MSKFIVDTKKFLLEDEGVTSIEYALLGALIAVVCVAAVTNVGTTLKALLTNVCNKVSEAISGAPVCS